MGNALQIVLTVCEQLSITIVRMQKLVIFYIKSRLSGCDTCMKTFSQRRDRRPLSTKSKATGFAFSLAFEFAKQTDIYFQNSQQFVIFLIHN